MDQTDLANHLERMFNICRREWGVRIFSSALGGAIGLSIMYYATTILLDLNTYPVVVACIFGLLGGPIGEAISRQICERHYRSEDERYFMLMLRCCMEDGWSEDSRSTFSTKESKEWLELLKVHAKTEKLKNVVSMILDKVNS